MGTDEQQSPQQQSEQQHDDDVVLTNEFKRFTESSDFEETLNSFQLIKEACGLSSSQYGIEIYDKIKEKVNPKGIAREFWRLVDEKRHKSDYTDILQQENIHKSNVYIVGCGPAGLRTGIEVCLMGGQCKIIEKRLAFTRNNALHLWPFSIFDLKSLGCKYFWGKFCSGLINHVAVKRMQLMLLKCALLLGVQVERGVEFRGYKEKSSNGTWVALVKRENQETDEVEDDFEFNILIGADGEKSIVARIAEFERRTFHGGLAIGITANFENHHTPEETALDEFGLMSIYSQDYFGKLQEEHHIQLENLVMYHDETHYFVMTPKKDCLLAKGVLIQDTSDTTELLSSSNINREALKSFVREVTDYCKLPSSCGFATSHEHMTGDQDDVEIFDFSRKQLSIEPAHMIETDDRDPNKTLLILLVGDALVEPFWPQGTGANRALLSALDASWTIKSFWQSSAKSRDAQESTQEKSLTIERGAYKLLQTATADDLKTGSCVGMDPSTR